MNITPSLGATRDIALFLGGSGLWFIGVGIHSIFLPWVLLSVLRVSPFQFGIAQMCLMLPVLLLVIYGGYLADRQPLRRWLARIYLCAGLLALVFAAGGAQGWLSYPMVLMYSLLFGALSAFCAPAREAWLNLLGQHQLQKWVTLNIGIEFGIQIVGYALGGRAPELGIGWMFVLLALLFVTASLSVSRISTSTPTKPRSAVLGETRAAWRYSTHHPVVFPVLLINGLIGVFFLGSYFVVMPLHVSQLAGGDASLLATANTVFMIGLIASVVTLVVTGGLRHKPRALLASCLLAALLLAALPFVFNRGLLLSLLFGWGFLGGVALSMGQTLIQEHAPPRNRAQVLALLMLFFMGGNPLGSLLLGTLLEYLDATIVSLGSALAMTAALLLISYTHRFWSLHHAPLNTCA
ncbi:MFS transporter [Pseudomonas sp. GD03842]|uniref:MFS transporter n=1 Tax=Pseudomonas sp. GD03842 TaxID=2975385 RepID=UPI002448D103|nr:MFS transporter [Pseudomonas sp. GD03842]MDH0748317.1 MFS transporter [Pseudomonas sp. GD03842]